MGTVCCCPGKKSPGSTASQDDGGHVQNVVPSGVREEVPARIEPREGKVSISMMRWLGGVQGDEDGLRSKLLQKGEQREAVPGLETYVSKGRRVAWKAGSAVICCSACGYRIAKTAQCSYTHKGAIVFDDFDVAIEAPNPQPGQPVSADHKRAPLARLIEDNAADFTNITCKQCKIFLGVSTSNAAYYCLRYISGVYPQSNNPLHAKTMIQCIDCNAPLSTTDQILCTHRRWSFNSAPSQPACYVNSVEEANIKIAAPREERLAQGRFMMADVSCKCGKLVGYKFCKDLSRDSRNTYQVGRYGLVVSCFAVSSFKISEPAAVEFPYS